MGVLILMSKENLSYSVDEILLSFLKNNISKMADRHQISRSQAFNKFLEDNKTTIEAYFHYQITYPFDEPEQRTP